MTKFEKYKFIKNELMQTNIDGYPIARVMGSYLAREIWSTKPQKLLLFFYMIFVRYSIKNPSDILLTNPSKRPSYQTLINNFLDQSVYNNQAVRSIKIRPRSPLTVIKFFITFYKFTELKQNCKIYDNFLIIFLKTYAAITIFELEAQNFKSTKYIAFNSSYFFESFLSFYFKKRAIKTSSLQHGIYYHYQNTTPFETINYENICADELLCWSQFTIDQIKELVPDDVILTKHIYPNAKGTPIYQNDLKINKILVLLPRIKYKSEIKNLIKLLKNTDKDFLIRPHPSSFYLAKRLTYGFKNFTIDYRDDLADTLLSGKFNFCIGFNTTSTFEAILYQQNVVQYVCGNDEFFLKSIPQFNSLLSFNALVISKIDYAFNYYLNPQEGFEISSKKLIVISAVNLRTSGTLAILEDVLHHANNFLSHKYKITALVHAKEVIQVDKFNNIEFIEFPKSSSSYLRRFYLEYFYFKKLSLLMNPYLWLSLQDLSANVSSKITAVYCHNASAFYKISLKEVLLDKLFFLQNILYLFFYSINIKKNDYIIIQQDWLRDKFNKIFNISKNKIIVSYPQSQNYFSSKDNITQRPEFVFLYPSFPRVFKNFELIFESVNIINSNYPSLKYKVIVTIDGSENKYTKNLLKKYSDLPNVEFKGLVTRDEVFELYKNSDCLVFPSKLETWGLPVSEAKEFGLPILISDLPYAHETVNNYNKVLFFNPLSSADLTDKMLKAMDNNFNEHAIEDPEQPFSNDWDELFKILLSNNK